MEKVDHNVASHGVTSGPVIVTTVDEGTSQAGTKDGEDATQVKSARKDESATAGGGGPKRGGTLAAFTPAPGAKPATFFELLAAAVQANRPEASKSIDFLEYLRKSGIKMAWVRAIVALYEEPKKPDDPLAYIVTLMGLGIPEPSDVKRMQDQVTRLRTKMYQLQAERAQLRQTVDELEVEALQRKESLISLYDQTKYFSEYNSDDDNCSGVEETQQISYHNMCNK